MELYNVCARLIERGKTDGLQRKLDVFYAVGSLTEDKYKELSAKLKAKLSTNSTEFSTER